MEFTNKEKEKIDKLSPIMKAILSQLVIVIDQILNGDCDYNEDHQEEIFDSLSILICPERRLSKYQAATKIGVSTRHFDRYISEGLIPKGQKQTGFKELSWKQSDINKYLSNKNKT